MIFSCEKLQCRKLMRMEMCCKATSFLWYIVHEKCTIFLSLFGDPSKKVQMDASLIEFLQYWCHTWWAPPSRADRDPAARRRWGRGRSLGAAGGGTPGTAVRDTPRWCHFLPAPQEWQREPPDHYSQSQRVKG